MSDYKTAIVIFATLAILGLLSMLIGWIFYKIDNSPIDEPDDYIAFFFGKLIFYISFMAFNGLVIAKWICRLI